ncbi:sulfur transferase domain-containing protein [uncultured Umboniibacter sp.]|uniref:fused DSP-PTPase phosphatase/NAD kinase-like protein n=1 Tax=uncultured Umboniibacter sp. TaxID=1798917 RepID=UPI002634309F|nr:sulfur transferase domain-containing protein [uncultured Umboniibacter sp.]
MRITSLILLTIIIVLQSCTNQSATSPKAAPMVDEPELGSILQVGSLSQVEDGIFAGGQPTASELEYLSRHGVKHVINLRPIEEQPFAEQSVVEGAGMNYHSIPVASANDVSVENAAQLAELLAEYGHEGVVVHCASGNRVGALVAITAAQAGASEDEAIQEGKKWGLTRLEAKTRQVIGAQ